MFHPRSLLVTSMSGQTYIETLPSLAETIVLDIIENHQPISGYQIRKVFTETTNKRLSFGTLVPMLHRFEKSGLVIRTNENDESGATSYNWFLTPFGSRQLDSRLSLLAKMLRKSASRREALHFSWEQEEEKTILPQNFDW